MCRMAAEVGHAGQTLFDGAECATKKPMVLSHRRLGSTAASGDAPTHPSTRAGASDGVSAWTGRSDWVPLPSFGGHPLHLPLSSRTEERASLHFYSDGGHVSRSKRILWIIVLVFVIYAIYNSPTQAASIAKSLGHIITVAVDSLFKFFKALLSK